MNLNNRWMNNPQVLAQFGHSLGGLAVVLIPAFLWGLIPAIVCCGVLWLLAVVKEFWYDMVYELPKQTIWDSLMDFGFYVLGSSVGMLLVLIKLVWLK